MHLGPPAEQGDRDYLRKAAALFVTGLVAIACTSNLDPLELPTYPVDAIDRYQLHAEKGGLVVAVNPVLEKAEQEKYFATDFAPTRVLPVFVVAENKRSDASFLLDVETIRLLPGTGDKVRSGAGEGRTADAVSERRFAGSVEALAWGGPIAMAMARGMVNIDNQSIAHQKARLALGSETLSPGMMAHGFVFFKIPESVGNHPAGPVILRIDFIEPLEQKTVSFDFVLDRIL